jgi:protein involved in polysaccharide export with SLBB domain
VTTSQLAADVATGLRRCLYDPKVTGVLAEDPREKRYFVTGDVRRAGRYLLQGRTSSANAVARPKPCTAATPPGPLVHDGDRIVVLP